MADLLTFHNDVYDQADATRIGSDNGSCIRTVFSPAVRTWECAWTTTLPEGSLTVQGPFYEKPYADSTLAVTGGTGAYARARGEMVFHAVNATEFSMTFKLAG